jgi:hypothetical protein
LFLSCKPSSCSSFRCSSRLFFVATPTSRSDRLSTVHAAERCRVCDNHHVRDVLSSGM